MNRSVISKLREGTEVLRTGGGATLTARDCCVVLDLVEEVKETIKFERADVKKLEALMDSMRSMSEMR